MCVRVGLILGLLVVLQGCQAINEDIKIALDCGDEANFDIKQMQVLAKRKFENVGDDFKCFMSCMLGKLEIYKNKQFQEEGYLKTYKNARPSVARKIFKGCKEEVEQTIAKNATMTECQIAFEFFKCNLDFRPVLYENRPWIAKGVQLS